MAHSVGVVDEETLKHLRKDITCQRSHLGAHDLLNI
jgi:hypothetical protein